MSQTRPNEQEIFDVARQMDSPELRASYLKQVCVDDKALESRLVELLAIHDADDSLLDKAPGGLGATVGLDPMEDHSGDCIGNYHLLQKIGEGGFGVVYMAEQTKPIPRKVALKIIKPGMDSKEVIARFESERQALAMMNHPNIANVLDGGRTPDGRPYFVMELVRGVSLTDFCDKKKLSLNERLALFMDVCVAIQHAHQKGVIHRDLKPANVMVTLHDGKPVVKVIDFGVAKAINQQLTEKTLFTRYGQMVGTPQYMSPEQAEMSGLDVDTRSDIYSLGVMLYELLVGTTPLTKEAFREVGYVEMQKLICEGELAPPTNRLSTTGQQQLLDIADHRGVSPEKLTSRIRGDLEWVVMKTLEKERDRRYASPLELSREIDRYLNNHPVEAHAPSIGYRAKKYIHRHRGLVAAVTSIISVLSLAVVFSTSMLLLTLQSLENEAAHRVRAEEERAAKEDAFDKVEKLASQLADQLYASQIEQVETLIETGDLRAAKNVLDLCSDNHRDWEWDHLSLLCKERSRRLFTVPGEQDPQFFNNRKSFLNIGVQDSGCVINSWSTETGEVVETMELPTTDMLTMVALHPDDRTIAVGTNTGDVFLADFDSKKILHQLSGVNSQRVDGIAFNPNGKSFAASGGGGEFNIWEVSTGKLLHKLNFSGGTRNIAYDPTGNFVTCGRTPNGGDCVFRVWDAETMEVCHEQDFVNGSFRAVDFSDDGQWLAVGHSGTGAHLLRVGTWEEEAILSNATGDYQSVNFSPKSDLVAAGEQGMVSVWDIQTGQIEFEFNVEHQKSWWMSFSPDQDKLAVFGTGSERKTIVFSLEDSSAVDSEEISQRSKYQLLGMNDKYLDIGKFSNDGTLYANGGANWTVKVWETTSGRDLATLYGHRSNLVGLTLSPDNTRVYSVDETGVLIAWNLATHQQLWMLALRTPHRYISWKALECSPDGSLLYAGTSKGSVAVIDTLKGIVSKQLNGKLSDEICHLALSPDGKKLVASAGNKKGGLLEFWDLTTEEVYGKLDVGWDISCLSMSPDSSKVLAVTSKGISIVNLDRPKIDRFRNARGTRFWKAKFTPSGQRIIASQFGTCSVLDLDGELLFDWQIPKCYDPSVSSKGTVAVSGLEGIVWLFEQNPSESGQRDFYASVHQAISIAVDSGLAEETIRRLDEIENLQDDVRDEAVRWVRKRGDDPIRLSDQSHEILLNREVDQYPSALKYALAADAAIPDCTEFLAAIGIAHYRNGNLDEAAAVLGRLREIDWDLRKPTTFDRWIDYPLDAHVFAVLAMAERELGNQDQAKECLEIAIQRLGGKESGKYPVHEIVEEAKQLLAGT
ncbi:protein kinase domain-containing protein [Novipirellula artificiosorum]|uniref:Serine/threonine-protein kinase PknB n=1 Tax=Novipirellula artificiosorum TaxID=2528016 RepID=A0A5C6DRB0_9BACT|nr:protein kinase [Novipirellula artificiosorum]TWU39380.1 Serine/threonine-protein kinase PknB [Novipirellula artificiosorum]